MTKAEDMICLTFVAAVMVMAIVGVISAVVCL